MVTQVVYFRSRLRATPTATKHHWCNYRIFFRIAFEFQPPSSHYFARMARHTRLVFTSLVHNICTLAADTDQLKRRHSSDPET